MTTRRELLKSSLPFAAAAAGAFAFDGLLQAQPNNNGGGGGGGLPDYFRPENFYADGEWKLPKLPYGYDAIEPHIDAKTMEIHHSKHHQAYVTNLNKAVKAMSSLKASDTEPSVIEALQRDISFNFGGNVLHSIYWATLGPGVDNSQPGGEADGDVAELINAHFGDFANFKAYFTKVATSIKGSGWAVLAHAPMSDQLVTYAVKDQDSTHAPGTLPILGVDVWEHAYYLKHQNDRAGYVKDWFDAINWSTVNMVLRGSRRRQGR